jgi:acyl-coenzyme A thioesterase PaaI-like protein
MPKHPPSLEELRAFFASDFPQSTVTIVALGDGTARVRQEIGEPQLRPGGTVSGPVMMATADAALYAALLGKIGIVPLAVTTNLSISFMRKPKAECALIADARLLKVGRKLAFGEVILTSEGDADPVAHATLTYALPS